MSRISLLLTVLSLSMAIASTDASESAGTDHYPEIQPENETLLNLESARIKALRADKLLMVVLGANWCHDSRAFVDHLDDPEFGRLIHERYVVHKINVGFYDQIRPIIAPWKIPVIYGTPTVIVLDPATSSVLNRESLPYWRNAASKHPVDAVTYFSTFAPGQVPASNAVSPALADALGHIDEFEIRQAERIYTAYRVLGDEMRVLGEERPDADFMKRWNNLASMRNQITKDLSRLKAEAERQAALQNSPIKLSFPDYNLFID